MTNASNLQATAFRLPEATCHYCGCDGMVAAVDGLVAAVTNDCQLALYGVNQISALVATGCGIQRQPLVELVAQVKGVDRIKQTNAITDV